MKDTDMIIPIRTRGPIGMASDSLAEDLARTPVRTRGPIRVRSARSGMQRQLTFVELLQKLREEIGDLPCTAFVHSWGSPEAEEFLARLSPLLRDEDALWLVPIKEDLRPPAPSQAGAVVLDLSRDTDQRIYRNMLSDLVFFPALEADEITQATNWRQRTRALIMDSRGAQSEALLHAGYDALLITYRWSGAENLEEYAGS